MENRIKELRKINGLSLQQIADDIGVGNSTISRYENGKREPKEETWQKLADCFDVPVPYLKGYTIYTCDSCGHYFIPDPNVRHQDIKCCPYCFKHAY
ncbi:MAG: helix-turn-helix domain-containing protein [Lactococcus plantarum]|nr:helix-turn-helix domain-containing protein [Lactococcus plantarum]